MADETTGPKPVPIWEDAEVRRILDGMVEPFMALDHEGRIAFANLALAERRSDEGLVGRLTREVWPELAGTEADEALRRAFATGIPARFDQRLGAADRWVEIGAHRSGAHLLVSFRDVTEARAAARRERSLRSIVDALPHIAWHVAADGTVTVNRRWQDYSGSDETTQVAFQAHIHPDDLPRVSRGISERDRGEAYEYDLRLLHKSGVYRWNHLRVAPYRVSPGEGLSWIGTTTDVHDQRMKERTLRLLLDVNETTRALSDPIEIVSVALRALASGIGLGRAAYGEVAEDENGFSLLRQEPEGRADPKGNLDDYGPEIAGDLRAGRVVVVSDAAGSYSSEIYAHFAARDSRAIVCAPIVRNGRLTAYLTAHSSSPRSWTEDEVEAVKLVADRCWTEVERARASQRARERETRLRALVESNPIGVVVVDIDTGFALEANDAWLFALGRTRAELEAGQIDIRAMSGEEGTAITDARISAARQGGKVGFYEKTYLKPDGTRVPVLVGFTPLDPQIRRATAFMVDLSELRRAEAAVVEGERRWRLLAETIPAIVFTLFPDGRVEYVNSRGLAFFGDGAKDALGGLAQSIAQGEAFQVERPMLGADRVYRWHLCRAEPMRGPDGEAVRWIGTLTDVHEAKSRERVLRFLVDLDDATANLTEPALAMREIAYMLAGAVGADRCAYAEVEGDEFTVLGDYARSGPSMAGRWALEAFGAEYADRMRAGKTYVADDAEGAGLSAEALANYEATAISAIVCASIVRAGRLVATMAVHQNRPRHWTGEEIALVEQVAERSWANIERVRVRRDLLESEEALRLANEGLEQKVAERTKELRDANEALQGFGYHVSHDLRTPLRAIVSTSRMLQMDFGDVLPEEADALLDRQSEAARKLGELIDDLLQLSRLSQAELAKTRVDVTALARDAAEEALSAHPETKVRIEVADGLFADADPRLLRLALVNLLENAVKYSPQGGTVRMAQRPNGDFTVSDEGIGMEPQYLERIFEPFQRLHRDEAFKGTGIGLANVRRVVTRHGGTVWAESEPGKGSTFVLRL